jgi:mRNA interferase YafQ
MKTLHYSTQYKKDFKKYRNQPEKLQKLLGVLIMLENEEKLPKELQAHKLAGQYRDCMECHIGL